MILQWYLCIICECVLAVGSLTIQYEMKNKKKSIQGIAELLPQLAQNRGWEEQLDLHSIFVHWHDLIDAETAAHCQPLKIVKKILWVEVENSAWLQQLQFQTVVLLKILNQSLRLSKLEGLRFCVAEKENVDKEEGGATLHYVQPSATDIASFEQQAMSISDEDVRNALVRFWYLSQACTIK